MKDESVQVVAGAFSKAYSKLALTSVIIGLLPFLFYLIVTFLLSYNDDIFRVEIILIPLCSLIGLGTGVIGIWQTRHANLRDFLLCIIGTLLSLLWGGFIILSISALNHI